MDEPFIRAFAVDSSTLRCSRAGRCQIRFVGAPFYGVSACDFHRQPKRPERNAHCAAFRQSLHCL